MNRIDQALNWWKHNVPEGTWVAPKNLHPRHSRILYRANWLRYEWKTIDGINSLYWALKEKN